MAFVSVYGGISLESSANARWSGAVAENAGAATVTTEIWPKQVALGPHASVGLAAFPSDTDVAAPVGVAGTSTEVDCGLAALVVEPVLTVPPAGSTYSEIAFGDGACTAIVVVAWTVRSSSSWSPSLVLHVTDEATDPVEEGTLMITVAETVAPAASVPN